MPKSERSGARAAAETAREIVPRDLQDRFFSEIRRRPARSLAIALGVGYLAGGGIGTILTARLLGLGARVALRLAPSSGRDLRDDLGRRIRRAAPDLDDPFTGDAADSIAREGETRSAT